MRSALAIRKHGIAVSSTLRPATPLAGMGSRCATVANGRDIAPRRSRAARCDSRLGRRPPQAATRTAAVAYVLQRKTAMSLVSLSASWNMSITRIRRGRRYSMIVFCGIARRPFHPKNNEVKQMQKSLTDRLIEKRSIDYIPIAERHGKVWHLWPVWFSGDAHLATVAAGVVGVALGGNLAWMAIAVVLGSAFGTFFMAFHSTQGPQLGLPQMIQSRPQFGFVGALLVWGVALIAYIGFNAFNQILAAQTVQSLYGGEETTAMLVFTAVSVALAIIGYDLIHIAQRWVAYVLIVALLVFSVAVAIEGIFPPNN
jgi:hypothetical protein